MWCARALWVGFFWCAYPKLLVGLLLNLLLWLTAVWQGLGSTFLYIVRLDTFPYTWFFLVLCSMQLWSVQGATGISHIRVLQEKIGWQQQQFWMVSS